MAGKFDNIL